MIDTDKDIRKMKDRFNDSRQYESIETLNKNLVDVKNILNEEFQHLLERENNLQNMSGLAGKIRESAIDFDSKAKKLKWQMFWRKYKLLLFIAGVVVFIIIFYMLIK